jgi:hypothetical protein
MRDASGDVDAQLERKCSYRETALREFKAMAVLLALLSVPTIAIAASDVAAGGYQRIIDLGTRPVEVQVRYGNAAPGSSALVGEGSVTTALPGAGRLTFRVPHVVGQVAALGNAQVAASYALVEERRFLPSLGVVAHLDLPTAAGSHEAKSHWKASVAKTVGWGVIEGIRLEGELWTEGSSPEAGYRTLVATTLRLLPSTRCSAELVSLHPGVAAGVASESFAQLGLSHRLSAQTDLRAGVAARVAGETNSLSATIGFDRRF